MSVPSGPTVGRRGGEHRVLEPPGAPPISARRLDALAELWDGEVRLELDAVVLTGEEHRGWVERLGPDVGRLTAAFVETIAERGGLGEGARGAVVVGRIVTVGPAHPQPVAVGERVAVAFPAPALPLFGLPRGSWDGSRVLPLDGHAIVPAGAVTVPVDDAPPALAAVLAGVAHLPASLATGARTVVIGVERPAGAVAVAVLAARLRPVTAVVGSLSGARLARALGADATVIAALDEPVDEAERVVRTSGGRPDLVVLADPAGAALAARVAPTVQLATPAGQHPTDALVEHARAAGRDVAVHLGAPAAPDRGAALRRLIADTEVLGGTLRWQAGLAPPPPLPTGDDLEPT